MESGLLKVNYLELDRMNDEDAALPALDLIKGEFSLGW
jgi:hypothetical protein